MGRNGVNMNNKHQDLLRSVVGSLRWFLPLSFRELLVTGLTQASPLRLKLCNAPDQVQFAVVATIRRSYHSPVTVSVLVRQVLPDLHVQDEGLLMSIGDWGSDFVVALSGEQTHYFRLSIQNPCNQDVCIYNCMYKVLFPTEVGGSVCMYIQTQKHIISLQDSDF